MPGSVYPRFRWPASGGEREQPPTVLRLVRGLTLACQHGVKPRRYVTVVIETQHLRLRECLGQPGPVALGEASRGHHLGAG